MKTKLYSALLIAITGLLLGGNVNADGAQMSASATQDVTSQIQQIRQRISLLTAQMQSRREEPAAVFAKVALSQEKLNYIQSQVDAVAKKVERLKVEVGVLVTLRQIKERAAALASAIAPTTKEKAASLIPVPVKDGTKGSASAGTSASETATATKVDKKAIEEQIVKVKQQITDLTQQLQGKTAANDAVTSSTGKCSGSSCSVSPSQTQAIASASVSATKSVPAQKKGFWQSVSDFFKKIFTF